MFLVLGEGSECLVFSVLRVRFWVFVLLLG